MTALVGAESLQETALRIRRHIVDMCAGPEGGHLGGSLSSADILAVLYFSVMNVDPGAPADPGRDVFLLSKGHGAIGLYATLAERGYFPVEELATYARPGSRLMGHPVRAVPGVEMPTGSLGHGLALGLGFALSARLAGRANRSFVLMGDGELQEGSCWEAAIAAAAQRADNLVAVIDRNGLQLTGHTEQIAPLEPLADRWRAFNWAVREVDGHDHEALREALASAPWEPGRPSALVARTVKGQGLAMVAGKPNSHYATLSDRMHARLARALQAGDR
ncbi:transketolase, N-terminal subunit [Sphaerisporangium siamense]|uniref:Transketolase n=1 Tax=Sphaerisporangium siamense TaxID=795645 RepID=A0A7W7D715_9ACTN|nr:transketolase [Sphaerisporangium siamense]MBB4701445.1 transketolase [Sphaerisporangium siamense]GII85568.1 transketolase, N-terminal subunit [Sphaerisporangium siamense]